MNTKRTVLVMLVCIILSLSQFFSGGVSQLVMGDSSESSLRHQQLADRFGGIDGILNYNAPLQNTVEQRNGLSLLAQMDNYEITLKIIGPDGLPSVYTGVYIIQTSFSFNPIIMYSTTIGDTADCELNLPRGIYRLNILCQNPQQYLAYCYLSVTGNNIITLDVRPFILPVTMEAINPLDGKPFYEYPWYIVRDTVTGLNWWFTNLVGSQPVIYLPINTKFDFCFHDWNNYLLFVKNIQLKGTSTKVKFDGSKTGYLTTEFVMPTNTGDYYAYGVTLDGFWEYIDASNPIYPVAVTVGSYMSNAYILYSTTEGDIEHNKAYTIDLGRVNIARNKTNNLQFGGDMILTAKANKSSYKPGDLVEIQYSIIDQFKHGLASADKYDYFTPTGERTEYPWSMAGVIGDVGGPLSESSWESIDLARESFLNAYSYTSKKTLTCSTYINSYASSGSYYYTVTWDSESYQDPISGSASVVIKSTSKIPELDYNHLSGQTVRVGVIASSTTSYETLAPYFSEIIQPDINAYYQSQGLDVNFEFQVVDAESQAQVHLDHVMAFHNDGVDLIIGGGWSSQAQASLNYVNTNNMILLSHSSTSPVLAIANDRLFRFCPSDSYIAPSLIDMLWSKGVRSVVIIQRGDSWGDGIVNLFNPAWTAKGGKLAGDAVRYDPEALDFNSYLQTADDQAAAALTKYPGKVAVLLLSFNEAETILTQAAGYSHIYGVKWYGADGTAASQTIIDNAGPQAAHIGLNSLLPQTPNSPEYQALNARYEALTGLPLGIYGAYAYDLVFALTGTIVQTESTDAGVVAAALPGFCKTYDGVTGNCAMNVYGDRIPGLFDIWRYRYVSGGSGPVEAVVVGNVNPVTHKVTWTIP